MVWRFAGAGEFRRGHQWGVSPGVLDGEPGIGSGQDVPVNIVGVQAGDGFDEHADQQVVRVQVVQRRLARIGEWAGRVGQRLSRGTGPCRVGDDGVREGLVLNVVGMRTVGLRLQQGMAPVRRRPCVEVDVAGLGKGQHFCGGNDAGDPGRCSSSPWAAA